MKLKKGIVEGPSPLLVSPSLPSLDDTDQVVYGAPRFRVEERRVTTISGEQEVVPWFHQLFNGERCTDCYEKDSKLYSEQGGKDHKCQCRNRKQEGHEHKDHPCKCGTDHQHEGHQCVDRPCKCGTDHQHDGHQCEHDGQHEGHQHKHEGHQHGNSPITTHCPHCFNTGILGGYIPSRLTRLLDFYIEWGTGNDGMQLFQGNLLAHLDFEYHPTPGDFFELGHVAGDIAFNINARTNEVGETGRPCLWRVLDVSTAFEDDVPVVWQIMCRCVEPFEPLYIWHAQHLAMDK